MTKLQNIFLWINWNVFLLTSSAFLYAITQCGLRLTQITDEFKVSKVFLYNSLILISAHPKIMPDGSFQFLALWKTDNKYMYMILFFWFFLPTAVAQVVLTYTPFLA